ncbi:MAG: S41 family peptidase [Lachnospiraceae bacterium]|nr:S41 family peptidase [Lachnospiraceae bacterium]
MNRKRSFVGGMIAGVVLTLFLGCGYYAGKQLYQAVRYGSSAVSLSSGESGTIGNVSTVQKLNVLEDMIDEYFLEEVDEKALEQGVYRGVIDALDDPYSTYYSVEELEELQNKTQGIYYGIGARVGIDTDTELARIAGVIPGTPAEEAGLLANDLIYKVDDVMVQGMDLSSIVAKVKGDEGTTVHLTIIREGESDYLEFDVVRRKLENETVVHKMLEDNIGYIQIVEFDDVTVDQFTDALATCKGSGMEGLILDLRGNPGGNLSTVCEISRMMLPKGLIVYTEDKEGNREEYTCDGEHPFEYPLVVLVDGNSASASEILAGAIKDYGIGTLVGTTTFGKGIVQRIMQLSDGSAVKLTVSKYFTPNGNDIHKIGIEPDVEVAFESEPYLEDGTDNQLNKAVEVLKEKIMQ